jgi:hypothetical protein
LPERPGAPLDGGRQVCTDHIFRVVRLPTQRRINDAASIPPMRGANQIPISRYSFAMKLSEANAPHSISISDRSIVGEEPAP